MEGSSTMEALRSYAGLFFDSTTGESPRLSPWVYIAHEGPTIKDAGVFWISPCDCIILKMNPTGDTEPEISMYDCEKGVAEEMLSTFCQKIHLTSSLNNTTYLAVTVMVQSLIQAYTPRTGKFDSDELGYGIKCMQIMDQRRLNQRLRNQFPDGVPLIRWGDEIVAHVSEAIVESVGVCSWSIQSFSRQGWACVIMIDIRSAGFNETFKDTPISVSVVLCAVCEVFFEALRYSQSPHENTEQTRLLHDIGMNVFKDKARLNRTFEKLSAKFLPLSEDPAPSTDDLVAAVAGTVNTRNLETENFSQEPVGDTRPHPEPSMKNRKHKNNKRNGKKKAKQAETKDQTDNTDMPTISTLNLENVGHRAMNEETSEEVSNITALSTTDDHGPTDHGHLIKENPEGDSKSANALAPYHPKAVAKDDPEQLRKTTAPSPLDDQGHLGEENLDEDSKSANVLASPDHKAAAKDNTQQASKTPALPNSAESDPEPVKKFNPLKELFKKYKADGEALQAKWDEPIAISNCIPQLAKGPPFGPLVFRFDTPTMFLKCRFETCYYTATSLRPGSTICPGCGIYSYVRYCSLEHMQADIRRHYCDASTRPPHGPECGSLTVPYAVDELTIGNPIGPVRPYIAHMRSGGYRGTVDRVIERHRQAVYRSMSLAGDYYIFNDIDQIPIPQHILKFMTLGEQKSHLQRVRGTGEVCATVSLPSKDHRKTIFNKSMDACLALGYAAGLKQTRNCDNVLNMIIEQLTKQGLWDARMCERLCVQFGYEFGHKVPENKRVNYDDANKDEAAATKGGDNSEDLLEDKLKKIARSKEYP